MRLRGPTASLNNFRQNHPELIVRDLSDFGLPPPITRAVLKVRGVNKWLAVRRLLIALKHRWKQRIHWAHVEKRQAKLGRDSKRYHQLVGYERALVECRQQIRALCHHGRDIDFPPDPKAWPAESMLPDDLPLRPNKRWLARRFGKVAA